MDWIDLWLIPLLKSAVLVVGLLAAFAYLTLFERKVVGRFQLRYGPNRAGPFGVLQPVADAIKAIFKEEFVLESAVSRLLYVVAPAVAMIGALMAFAAVPLGRPVVLFGREVTLHLVGDVGVAVLLLFAVMGLGEYGVVLGGWSSNNKYALLGALRTTAQLLSYELPMGLAVLSVVAMVGSLSMVEIVEAQARVPFVVVQPVACLVFFICVLAAVNRSPFDLPETENELVSGFNTEYGGIKFALFFMAEYINMVVAAGMVTTLFLGGYLGPGVDRYPWLGVLYFGLKVGVLLFLFVWIRASLPRVRLDRWMRFAWGFLLPLMLVNLAVTAIAVVWMG